jgi:aminopeptidase S
VRRKGLLLAASLGVVAVTTAAAIVALTSTDGTTPGKHTDTAAPSRTTTDPTEPPPIDVADVKAHLAKLQSIADATGGNRAAGTEGYANSVDYVAGKLEAAGFTVQRQQCTICTTPTDENIIADWPGGDAQHTIMFGAHLDSVGEGPGINDNGSGSAAVLEIALTLAETKPAMAKHVRLSWFADEEEDLGGSYHYVEQSGVEGIEAFVNLDMIASPNAGYFLSFPNSKYARAISAYLDERNIPVEEWPGDCECSDDAAFTEAGVPTTYFNTGDEDTMTKAQAEKWDGTAAEDFDECYHSACDSHPKNINSKALDITTNATMHALWTLAVDTGTR